MSESEKNGASAIDGKAGGDKAEGGVMFAVDDAIVHRMLVFEKECP
jgi:hypothetical protein